MLDICRRSHADLETEMEGTVYYDKFIFEIFSTYF